MPLISGGRDLDNYLLPLVTRLGANRFAAVFGRKFRGWPWLAVGLAQPAVIAAVTTRMTGSYVRQEWKWMLQNQLLRAGVRPVEPGPVAIEIALTTGPDRNTEEVAATMLAKTPYDLRHAAVSTWFNGGVPPTTVAEWAGQSLVSRIRYSRCMFAGVRRIARLGL